MALLATSLLVKGKRFRKGGIWMLRRRKRHDTHFCVGSSEMVLFRFERQRASRCSQRLMSVARDAKIHHYSMAGAQLTMLTLLR